MTDFQDHFAPQAGQYATYRPRYPAAFIARVASLAPGRALAWDVGTGSGQAAVPLAEHFARVHATDASERQVAHAEPHPRVTYLVAAAERSGLDDGSVDLVTVAQALHWFAGPAFNAEVRRVLRPRGVLVAWSYGLLSIDPAVDAVVRWFYDERLGRWWPPERQHVETRYAGLDFPFDDLDMEAGAIEASLTRDAVVGYVSTWSALRHARDGEGGDPLQEFERALRAAWPTGETRAVRWPLIVRAGRKG